MGAYSVLCSMDSTGVWVHIVYCAYGQYGDMGIWVHIVLQYGPGALCLGMYIQLGYGCTFGTGCLCVVALSGKPFVAVVALKKAVEKKKKDG